MGRVVRLKHQLDRLLAPHLIGDALHQLLLVDAHPALLIAGRMPVGKVRNLRSGIAPSDRLIPSREHTLMECPESDWERLPVGRVNSATDPQPTESPKSSDSYLALVPNEGGDLFRRQPGCRIGLNPGKRFAPGHCEGDLGLT
jgi:hypothetical protein